MKNGASFNLIDFLSHGDLCGVHVGDSKSKVIDVIGKPSGWCKSNSTVFVDDCREADLWGYGAWTLYFIGDNLDAVTFLFNIPGEDGFFFEINGISFNGNEKIDGVREIINSTGLPCFDLPRKYFLHDELKGGEIARVWRGGRVLLVGDSRLGRVTFDKESGIIEQISFPFSVAFQTNGLSYINKSKNLKFID